MSRVQLPNGDYIEGRRNGDAGRWLIKWMLGIAATIILTGGVGWITYIQAQVTDQGKQMSGLNEGVDRVDKRLDRIEDKLDRLLER